MTRSAPAAVISKSERDDFLACLSAVKREATWLCTPPAPKDMPPPVPRTRAVRAFAKDAQLRHWKG